MRALKFCRAIISPLHRVPFGATHILNDPSHVLYYRVSSRYRHVLKGRYDREEEGLWLRVTGNHLSKKRVVKSWAKRRLEAALWDRLKAGGYGRHGRRLTREQEAEETHEQERRSNHPRFLTNAKSRAKSLVGSVQIHVQDDIIQAEFQEVHREAGRIVDEIIKICGTGAIPLQK